MELLKVVNISKSFGGLQVVNNISFSANKGEIVGLIGTNGAGKTTCFNMISGFTPIDSGQIHFRGQSIENLTPYQICNHGIVRTFQITSLFSGLSVLENVMTSSQKNVKISLYHSLFQTKTFRKNHHLLEEKGEEILQLVGLYHKRKDKASGLSYGEQRRLSIANALSSKPELLLLDEPAAGLNPSESIELMNLILSLKDMGITILFVEHDMKLVMNICNRVIVMNQGMKVTEGTPDEVCKNKEVIRIYLGNGKGETA